MVSITATAFWIVLTGLIIEFVFRLIDLFSKEMQEVFRKVYIVCMVVILIVFLIDGWSLLKELVQDRRFVIETGFILIVSLIVSLLINRKPVKE